MKGILAIKERPRAILYLVITATLWSLGGLLVKSVNSNPMAIAGVRSGISAIILLLATGKPKLNWSFPQIAAAVCYSATVLLFVSANKNTTAANAVLIQYIAPIYVALLGAWLLKEKVRLLDWVSIAFAFGGMLLFFLDDVSTEGMLGNILAAVSGFFFAMFTIFMRMQKDGSPIESVILGNILTAVIGMPFLLRDMPDGRGWFFLAVLGVAQLGLPYVLYSKAIRHVTALEAVLIPIIELILSPLWVFMALGETPDKLAVIGGIVIIVVVTGRCLLSIRLPQENAEPPSLNG